MNSETFRVNIRVKIRTSIRSNRFGQTVWTIVSINVTLNVNTNAKTNANGVNWRARFKNTILIADSLIKRLSDLQHGKIGFETIGNFNLKKFTNLLIGFCKNSRKKQTQIEHFRVLISGIFKTFTTKFHHKVSASSVLVNWTGLALWSSYLNETRESPVEYWSNANNRQLL